MLVCETDPGPRSKQDIEERRQRGGFGPFWIADSAVAEWLAKCGLELQDLGMFGVYRAIDFRFYGLWLKASRAPHE